MTSSYSLGNTTRGNWTTKGCDLKIMHKENATFVCECNHLTNFAVLVVSTYSRT